jgi:4-hydroxybenzoate polyprenyltransferase
MLAFRRLPRLFQPPAQRISGLSTLRQASVFLDSKTQHRAASSPPRPTAPATRNLQLTELSIYRSGATLIPSDASGSHKLTPANYTPPKTGILSYLPPSWVPYAELARIEKPTGSLYLWFPTVWSTLMAASMATPLAPVSDVFYTSAHFTTVALIMRGAGCTINDLWDRNIDNKVARTRFRPLARRAITPCKAVVFAGVQCVGGLGILLQFPLEVIYAGIPSIILVVVYPGMKRVISYPQVVLGMAFSWGTMLGFPALGLSLTGPVVATTAACLFLSNVAWTVLYDTIYAYQDVEDDKKIGVKSSAVASEGRTKLFLSALAVTQVSLLAGSGFVSGMGPVYFVWSCGGSAVALGWMIKRLDFKNPQDCARWFKWCAWAVGAVTVGGGLLGEYTYRKITSEAEDPTEEETAGTAAWEIAERVCFAAWLWLD